ncbi:MAG: phosphatidate cytidylyltransferase [Porticoccaceae bacterium]|nr:phosphatidate cytidylyltransferase [Porticoccaceae bacterium]MDG1475119.1 phosphatidate cytidylyltransferase [Porticoccaceae bacterium]
MLKQRIITAILMAAGFVVTLFYAAPLIFSLAIVLVILLAGWEWTSLLNVKTLKTKLLFLFWLFFSLIGSAFWLGLPEQFLFERAQTLLLGVVGLWMVMFLWVQGYPSSAILWSPTPVLSMLGIVLLNATWVSVTTVLLYSNGKLLLLLGILIVVLADVGGFIIGKLFGKHKLAASVSPGKTWEGFFGGILFQSALIGSLFLLLPEKLTALTIGCIFAVALFSVLGDLFESMIKRHSGVKDSGNLLPGHGGVLDRVDGVMAALPIYTVLLPISGVV